MTQQKLTTTLEGTISSDGPFPLPYCAYPKAGDVAQHGVQPLPPSLPLVDLVGAQPYRSRRYSTVVAADLTPSQMLQMARGVAFSFARREPQVRHLRSPKHPPARLMEARHSDPFGSSVPFGPWTTETLMYWFIRLYLLTNPTSPQGDIRVNEEVLTQSLAILDQRGQVIAGAFRETMPHLDVTPGFRQDDPFLAATFAFTEPMSVLLGAQDAEALTALCKKYSAFREAYAQGKVGHNFMVARAEALAKEDAFELVVSSVERYQVLGYAFIVVEATNQWTGAACEALGGVRVHFAPFRAQQTVRQSAESLEGAVTTPNGFLSDKDSGSMFYVIRIT